MFPSTDGGISFVDDASALLGKPGLHPKEVREVLETSKLILSGSKPLLVDDELYYPVWIGDYNNPRRGIPYKQRKIAGNISTLAFWTPAFVVVVVKNNWDTHIIPHFGGKSNC